MKKKEQRWFFRKKNCGSSCDVGWIRTLGRSMLLLLLLTIGMPAIVRADDMNSGMISFDHSFIQRGYIDVKVPVFDDHQDDEWVTSGTISMNDIAMVTYYSNKQGEDNWYWAELKRTSDCAAAFVTPSYTDSGHKANTQYALTTTYERYAWTKEGSTTYATIRIYPPASILESKSISTSVKFKYHGSDKELSSNDMADFSMPDSPALNWGFSTNPGYQAVTFSGTNNDKYTITDHLNLNNITSTGSVSIDYKIQNTPRTVELTYYKKVSDYQFVSARNSIVVPAYQFPTDFKAEMKDGGDVQITWSIGSTSNYVSGDNFEIQRSEDTNFSTYKSIGTVPFDGAKSYKITDNSSKENLNGEYFYRLRRTKSSVWDWNYMIKTSTRLAMSHKYIASATASMVGRNGVYITWTYDGGNIWSDNTDVMLRRTNEMKGTSEVYMIPRDSVTLGHYTDYLMTTCDVYSYMIYLKPGNTSYQQQEALKVISSENLYTLEMGKVVSINASKGYFSDRVELDWTTDGKSIDAFSIRSRRYNSGDSFKQIEQLSGNVASTHYQYSDTKSVPGVIYEYQIVAIATCGGENRMLESATALGFRTPTGDIYGRVTFEDGQAVENVEVRAEGSDVVGRNYHFTFGDDLTVDNTSLLDNVKEATLQAWVQIDANGTIVKKPGMYELVVENGNPVFKVGSQKLVSKTNLFELEESYSFVHLTASATSDSLYIYINGDITDRAKRTSTVIGNGNAVKMGGDGFIGNIDEVRIWGKALDAETVMRDYRRYLTGSEDKLLAYYTFDYAVENHFYDVSYEGTKYHENHGTVNGAVLASDNIPSASQLGYKGITSADGSYAIRANPYVGKGSSYTIIPYMGIHQFESQKEVRFINANAQSYTVNFTDKSSFNVSGVVTYEGSTIPVEGVTFEIDGKVAMSSKGAILQSDANGEFAISVPVGTHEVVAVKNHHQFANDGRFTTSDGLDINYQDDISGIKLYDRTTVRYIGRVAGGSIQNDFPIGHSLSTNNLADSIKVQLTFENAAYKVAVKPHIDVLDHFKPANQKKALNNEVLFQDNKITISVNQKTGEFVADVFPVSYSKKVIVPGYEGKVSGANEILDLSNAFVDNTSVHNYIDSTEVDGAWEKVARADTVHYNMMQKHQATVEPQIQIVQMDQGGNELPYFGEKTTFGMTADGKRADVDLYNEETGTYLLGRPAFAQNTNYTLKASVFEGYAYYDAIGKVKSDVPMDKVPTPDAVVSFKATMYQTDAVDVETDSVGVAMFTFPCLKIELTDATADITATGKVGVDDSAISFDWENPLNGVVVLGIQTTGSSFVTAGPNKMLTVLRDPPGSHSYSYLEKGTSFTETSSYSGEVTNSGAETLTHKLGTELVTYQGAPGAGVINSAVTSTGFTLGVEHEENVGGTHGVERVTTTTTRFQTSDDPLYDGPNGDVYIGYSTNIIFGVANSINLVSREKLEAAGESAYEKIYSSITPVNSDWVLVQQNSVSFGEKFGTMFAYPQVHIENILIPNWISARNNMFRFDTDKSDADFQAEADQTKRPVIVSHLKSDDPNFGLSNTDEAFKDVADPDPKDQFNGPSYHIFFPSSQTVQTDSILYINQTIEGWKKALADNEKAKVNAVLMQNYSFHAGSPVEYSESYTHTTVNTQSFHVLIGGHYTTDVDVKIFGSGFNLNIDETVTTQHGGDFSQADAYSHSKGFVLAEDGDDDYLSVDVCYEKDSNIKEEGGKENDQDNHYSSFIFKTKGGVTSCPYEGEYVTQYYEPGKHIINAATMQIEVPQIAVEKDFIENVPSGQPAYLTVFLRNNSEVQQEVWYDLKIDDTSNPNGARFTMDGGPIGNGRAMFLPAGETLVKTIEVNKGSAMEYDNLKLMLISQCQGDASTFIPVIADTVSFSVHFTPSCTDVNIAKPTNNWTYNTKLPTVEKNGLLKHYMDVVLDGFDVNYDNFNRIELQYKASSESDNDWKTLNTYFNDSTLYKAAIEKGLNAEMILASDAGTIRYKWLMDDLSDQRYDLRAVSVCLINGLEIENTSETRSGIKDMYIPRLFGSAQPANGILSINDEIRLNFNEKIADGYLTKNNFQVTGIRNGAQTDHSVSVQLDGINDALVSAQSRNWKEKNITAEMWINADKAQNTTLFSQGNANNPFELAMTADNKMVVRIGSKEIVSSKAVPFDKGSWAHVAVSCDDEGNVSAYYNFTPYIDNVPTGAELGEGNWCFGHSLVKSDEYYAGKIHNARIWNKLMTTGVLQTNSLTLLSGSESGLLAYYPMDETKGEVLTDKAQGLNLSAKGAEWALPEGRSAQFDGASQYLLMSTGAAAIDESMDYTMEFWFKADASQKNAVMASNGRGDGLDNGGSENLFALGFENGVLTFRNNSAVAEAEGDYLDNNWHHFALSFNRNTGRAQICIDGVLNKYFDIEGFGHIASDAICLGARRWVQPETITPIVDNYFKGSIDEFRLWNHYRNADIISNNNSKHLSGEEKGLLAYYPFEKYIQGPIMTETTFTLADQKVPGVSASAVPDATVSGGNVESQDKAPVKPQGAVEELNYTFVVNDDALIINLTEPWERVEKTIVNFTVDGVRDMNGNEIASPVSWSAYIDRNQLKWAEPQVDCDMSVYEGKTFTVDIVNKGGSVQNFVIDNMPSWLHVSPTSGSINPTGSQKITFTVDKSLNIGTYNELINMRNDNNVIETLPVNVKVNGEKPDWSVNPKDFKYNMNVYGKMRINNIFSNDKEDMLAAFVNGQCVGVTSNLYHEASDMWYAYLTVYNNSAVQDKLEFRIWDASTGKVYLADAGQTIAFRNNDVIGTAAAPVIFDTKEIVYQNINLDKGWNWISFNVCNNSLSDVNETLSNCRWSAGDIVKSETNGFDSYSLRSGWVGLLSDNGGFDNESMFMINATTAKTLSISGSPINFTNQKIDILGNGANGEKRWNYIAYQPTISQTVKEALSGYDAKEGDVIKSQDAFAMYADNLGWIGNLTYMEPGKGYMLQRNDASNATITYSQVSSSKGNARKAAATRAAADDMYVNHDYSGSMNVIAEISDDLDVNADDKIRAYVDGELRGEAAMISTDSQNLFFINVCGEKSGTLTFDVVRDNQVVAQADNQITFENNQVVGSVASPLKLNFRQHKATGVYPNPFTDELFVVADLAQGDKADVMITDIAGNIVYRYAETAQADGQMNLKWNGECLPGIYIVKVTVNNTVQVFKVEKK